MLFLNDVRRQESQHRFLRPINQDSLLQQLLNRGLGSVRGIQFHAEHESHTTYFLNGRMPGAHVFKTGAEVVAHFLYVIQQSVEGTQKFDCYGACQWSSTERRAVHAGMHSAGYPVCGEQRPQRQSRCQRFGYREDVWLNAVMLVGEVASGTA